MSERTLRLRSGGDLPVLGYGVWQVSDEDAGDAVRIALESGFRLIDTAQGYGNERGTGVGLAESDVAREDVFLTTKLDAATFGYDDIRRAFDASIRLLGVDYLDAYLIHWPRPGVGRTVETWNALRRIRDDGQVRAIGVCNFEPHHLTEVITATGEAPDLNQIERHPWLPQHEIVVADEQNGIVTQAWSPLASGALLDDPVVVGIARDLDVDSAQVIMAWHAAHGHAFVVKSVTPARIRANARALALQLDETQVRALDALASGRRTGPHPDEF